MMPLSPVKDIMEFLCIFLHGMAYFYLIVHELDLLHRMISK